MGKDAIDIPEMNRSSATEDCVLVDVLIQLPYADTVEKLEELLPWNFKKSELDKVKNAAH